MCVLGPDDHRAALDGDEAAAARLASVGRPVPGIEVRVVEAAGNDTPTGVAGEIVVRGSQVSGEYVGQGRQCDDGGWLHTGDRGYLDADSYLFVDGRGDDTIIGAGENIAPAEIEDVLLRHPAIASAAVVALPDEEWGAKVGAMLTLRSGATVGVDERRAFARDSLGSLKAPEVLVLRDELPHTDTGKILRRQVRAELLDQS